MFAIFAVLIGIVVAIQSRINGQLSVDLNNGLAAALVSFITGLALVTILVFGFKREREALFRIFEAIKNKQLVTKTELMSKIHESSAQVILTIGAGDIGEEVKHIKKEFSVAS